MLAVRVKKIDAELARRILSSGRWIDKGRLIQVKSDYVEIPIRNVNLPKFGFNYEIIKQTDPVFNSKEKLNFRTLKEKLVREFGKKAENIRGGWEVIGDILIIDLPKELEDEKYLVGEKLRNLFPRINSVVIRRGIVGDYRKPMIELISGTKTNTIHKENYCYFKIDVSRVMFCAGNMDERRRMAFISNSDEVVVDMFAGIGQFTVPMAKHSKPKKIYAIEKNPSAFEFLKENIRLNKLNNVAPILGDCRLVCPQNIADRVIMGYFFDPHEYLPTAVKALREGGIIHYHFLSTKDKITDKWRQTKVHIKRLGSKVSLNDKRIVKSYAPKIWHVVFDLEVK
jgi:tRNA wybutosine-synthesizing protein 2